MAANYLHSLADENPDLRKQIGCMTGVFKVFNRHHMVAGRRVGGYSPKRGRPGGLIFNNGTPERESSVTSQMEKHRISTESSKDSFSSWSPASPYSYLDCNTDGRPHPEPEHMKHQNLDLRDVVKDSMYREARGLSHKNIKKDARDNVAAKLRETNWYCDEPRQVSRSKSCQYKEGLPFSIYKDYPRFPYDGREIDHLSTPKTTTPKQLKELPRLSLDSRERSIHTSNFVSFVPIKPSVSKSDHPSRNPKGNGDNDLIQTRPPSVVAKLMGLETFPDSASIINKDLGVGSIKDHLVEDLNPSSKPSEVADDRGLIKVPNSTRNTLREPTSPCRKNPDMKPISKVSIEPAPWKQRDACVSASLTKIRSPVSSVYGEVDKRLKNLEFEQSGKDLRALKQILEAMQTVEVKKRTERSSDHEISPPASRGSDVSEVSESHIVIMKPAKLVGKGSKNNKMSTDLITESTRAERQSRQSKPLKESNKPRKQSGKNQPESRSSNSKKRPSNVQQAQAGRSLKTDTEVNASEYSEESNSRQSSSSTPEKSTLLVKVGEPLTPEYPSPVSVLDDSVYMDNSPSPVKHDATQDPAKEIVKDRYEATNGFLSTTIISADSSQFKREKLKKIEDLVQKLKRLNSDHNEAQTDYIASLCEKTNPNDRYISEILLASGILLRDLGCFEFHSSGHPINPELFLVLEHTRFSNLQKGKFHRKLIFDSVNDILVRKFSSPSKMKQNPRKLLSEVCLEIEQQQVHKKGDMCDLEEGDELKRLLWKDVLKKSENWTDFHDESHVIAVEVERLIFRDLVNEIVMSEVCDG
ncbi:longifolia 1-like protein [Tanacetum coccineum]